jgi:hypothetical protein
MGRLLRDGKSPRTVDIALYVTFVLHYPESARSRTTDDQQ